jgi:hypothetical protein
MYRDPKQWAYVRHLVLQEGKSLRAASRKTGLSRTTVRKMLAYQPPVAATPNGAMKNLYKAAHSLGPVVNYCKACT